MKLWLFSIPIHIVAVHQMTQSSFTHLAVVHHLKKSRITYQWVVHQETRCRVTYPECSPKDTVKAYTQFNYSDDFNVALWLMRSVQRVMEVERTATLSEDRRRIRRQIKLQPKLEAEMMLLVWLVGNLKFSNAKLYYPVCKINSNRVENKTFVLVL